MAQEARERLVSDIPEVFHHPAHAAWNSTRPANTISPGPAASASRIQTAPHLHKATRFTLTSLPVLPGNPALSTNVLKNYSHSSPAKTFGRHTLTAFSDRLKRAALLRVTEAPLRDVPAYI